jgi:hypothetical protein
MKSQGACAKRSISTGGVALKLSRFDSERG